MARKKKEQPKETIQGTSEQLPVEVSTQDTQNETEESQSETVVYTQEQIEASRKAMDELMALDQELGLYDPPEAHTIALEEESTETDTEVALTENVAVNESEEVLEEWVEPTTPEHFLFNVYNQPIPATLILLREMKLQTLVEKLLYIGSLGGELYPQGIRLGLAPFVCKVLIPTEKLEAYNNLEGKLEYDETKEYLDINIRATNSPTFIKRLLQVGKKGAVLAPSKAVSKVGGFSVSLKSLAPLEPSASVSVGVNKPIYSLEELKAMKSESLKIVSSWYKLPWQGSNHARILIRKAQEGK